MFWKTFKPILKLLMSTMLIYVTVGVSFVLFYFVFSLVSSGINFGREGTPPVRIEGAVLAPVAFGNPFLPYRDITPRILNESSFHEAGQLDYLTPIGTPLYAPEICPCVVVSVGFDGFTRCGSFKDGDGKDGNGNSYMNLRSEDGQYNVRYMHGEYTVVPGDIVAPGTRIGSEASIGCSTEPHTDVLVKKNGATVNVKSYDGTAIVTQEADTRVTTRGVTGQYSEIINKYAKQYSLDPAIVKGMIQQESNFNPSAVSPSGAKGLMQIMPAAQSDQCPLANLFDPEQNIACGTKHLRWSIDQMGGDLKKGIMSYHSGVGNQRNRGATSLDLYYYDQIIRYSRE